PADSPRWAARRPVAPTLRAQNAEPVLCEKRRSAALHHLPRSTPTADRAGSSGLLSQQMPHVPHGEKLHVPAPSEVGKDSAQRLRRLSHGEAERSADFPFLSHRSPHSCPRRRAASGDCL